jgi:DNA (cytosine-5)-methyltransferase 1
MVSILGDYHYEFPLTIPLELRLKDYLEESVDEKYYVDSSKIKYMKETNFTQSNYDTMVQEEDGICSTLCARDYKDLKCVQVAQMQGKHEESGRIYSKEGISPTINTCGGGNREPKIVQLGNYSPSIAIPEATKQTLKTSGNDLGVVIGSAQKNAYIGSVNGTCPTLNAAMGLGGGQTPMIANSLRIRKLTPRECGRLMSVDDEEITKMLNVVSNSQAYKQFGNGLIVDVFAGLLKGLISREAEGEI